MLTSQSPIQLKIKAASLAAEARIIRGIEVRLKKRRTAAGKERVGLRDPRIYDQYRGIHDHRCKDIRSEARATHLARTFLRGQLYCVAEQKVHSWPPFERARQIAAKYAAGDKQDVAQAWERWLQEAKAHWSLRR